MGAPTGLMSYAFSFHHTIFVQFIVVVKKALSHEDSAFFLVVSS